MDTFAQAGALARVWVAQAASFGVMLGIGTLVEGALKRRLGLRLNLGERGLLGFIAAACAATWVHLFLPLHHFWIVLYACGAVGLLVTALSRARAGLKVRATGGDACPSEAATWLYMLGMLGLMVIIITRFGYLSGDTGRYHLQAVKWYGDYPAVFGLANLHHRFGYNSSPWFSLAASLGPAEARLAQFSIAPVLCALIMGAIFGRLGSVPARASSFGIIVLAVCSLKPSALGDPINLGGDQAVSLLIVYSAFLLLAIAGATRTGVQACHPLDAEKPAGSGACPAAAVLFLAGVLAVFAAGIKLSAAPLLVALGLAMWRWPSRAGRLAVMISAVLVLAPWLLHGIIMSGCAFFPLSHSCFSQLAWAVPPADVTWVGGDVRAWARHPGPDYETAMTGWHWVRGWFVALMHNPRFLGCLAIGTLGFALLAARKRVRALFELLPVLAVMVLGCIFCFVTAPDLRFAIGYCFSLAAVLLACGLAPGSHAAPSLTDAECEPLPLVRRGGQTPRPQFGRVSDGRGSDAVASWARARGPGRLPTACTACFLLLVLSAAVRLVLAPDPQRDWPAPASAPTILEKTRSGMPVFVPRPPSDECWESPLPCTPHFNVALVRREYRGRPLFKVEEPPKKR